MSSAFIINMLFSNLLIDSEVHQKFHGTKKSQERFLENLLKMKEDLARFSNEQNNRQSYDNVYLEITETQINQAIEYTKKALEEA
jgi:hypothetical protein